MKLFQNKFFITCLCVAVVLCAVPSTLALMGYRGLARNIVGTITVPFRWCVTSVGNAFEGFGKYFTSLKTLQQENQALEDENAALKEQVARAERLEKENERLRAFFEMKAAYPELTLEEGMIISYSAGNYMTSFTLNRGTMHGIAVNMPVVVPEGIVGYVTDVGLNWCMVSTLIESSGSVGAYAVRSGAVGIVSGDAALRKDGICKMSYMEPNADIKVGDLILSNGNGSVYPAELVIGYVTAVEIDAYSRTPVATVQPAVDFASLQYMMIVKGYGN